MSDLSLVETAALVSERGYRWETCTREDQPDWLCGVMIFMGRSQTFVTCRTDGRFREDEVTLAMDGFDYIKHRKASERVRRADTDAEAEREKLLATVLE